MSLSIAPWIETILRLWDDPAFYEEQRRRCLQAADRWNSDAVARQYDQYFRTLLARHV